MKLKNMFQNDDLQSDEVCPCDKVEDVDEKAVSARCASVVSFLIPSSILMIKKLKSKHFSSLIFSLFSFLHSLPTLNKCLISNIHYLVCPLPIYQEMCKGQKIIQLTSHYRSNKVFKKNVTLQNQNCKLSYHTFQIYSHSIKCEQLNKKIEQLKGYFKKSPPSTNRSKKKII